MQPTDKMLAWHDDPEKKVLFTFECPKCHKKKGVYDTGEEWVFSHKCSRCQTETKHESNRVGNVITTTYACPMCGETEQDTLDLDEKHQEPEPDPNLTRIANASATQKRSVSMLTVGRTWSY